MNIVKITQFKVSGKLLNEITKDVPANLKPWDDEFEKWAKLQAWSFEGFVVVSDDPKNIDSFARLYKLRGN